MARQSGLGRGLASLLPGNAEPHPVAHILAPYSEVTDVSNLGVAMVDGLAGNESGLAIIYHALDSLVAEHDLADAAVVIDEPVPGSQTRLPWA